MPKFEVPDVFSTIISSYDVSNPELQKPHPHIANTILEKHWVSPEEAILVGDARGDVAMARAAWVTPVVVLTGYLSQEEAENLEVEYILRDVGKIGTLFDN